MDSIKGFLNYNEILYPFYYEDECLSLFPPDERVLLKDKPSIGDLFHNGLMNNEKREFINHINLTGTTSKGQDIIFNVVNNPSNDNGFLSFEVYSIFEYNKTTTMYVKDAGSAPKATEGKRTPLLESRENSIRGFYIQGDEINYFLEASHAFSSTLEFDDTKKGIESVSVETKREKEYPCGNIRIGDVEIDIFGQRYASYKNDTIQPLTAKSRLIFAFSKEGNVDIIQDLLYSIRKCFYFLCNRKTMRLNEAEVFSVYQEGKRNTYGKYAIIDRGNEEQNQELKKRIIPCSVLGERLGHLLQDCVDDKVYTTHIPDSYAKRNTYEPDRMIFDCVAFEKEYRRLFPEDKIRSKAYLEAKSDVLRKVDELIAQYSGKKKNKAKSIKKSIEKLDTSFGDRVINAVKLHSIIMDEFIVREYGKNTPSIVKKCGERLNALRNAFAHGNMDYEIIPEHLSDLKIIEILFYAMQLRSIGMEDQEAKKAICGLFGIHI